MNEELARIVADTLRVARKNPGATWGLWADGIGWARDGHDCAILDTDPFPVIARFYNWWRDGGGNWRPRMVQEWVESLTQERGPVARECCRTPCGWSYPVGHPPPGCPWC